MAAKTTPPNGGKKPKKQFVDLAFGPLPVEKINKALKLELDPGPVIMTVSHQIHVNKSHPDDYARLLPHVAGIIANPLYAGDDGRNPESFELIGMAPVLKEMMLVAIKFDPDEDGNYRIASFYPMSDKKIQSRKDKGYLKIVVS